MAGMSNAAFIFAGLIQAVASLQWQNQPMLQNNVTIPACPGQDVALSWDYTTSPDENILDVEWRYTANDGSEKILATQVNGHFFPDPGVGQRMVYLPDAGIRLQRVTAADSGTYSVHVNLNLHGAVIAHVQSVYVNVTEAPVVTSGTIQAHYEGAQFVNSTQEHHLVLSCGVFSQLWLPKVNVVWKTPRNQTLPSTFQNGTMFYLAVPNPFVSGEYTCKIDKSSPVMVCIESGSPLRKGTSVAVDGLQGRIALIDSEMQALRAEEAQMQSQIDDLEKHSLELRLVDGYNNYEGRVEAKLRGRSGDSWGAVCDDNWTTEDAEVVCKQLGLPSASARAWTSGRFGQGSGSIVMDSVNCNGSESSLLDCSFAFGQHNCGHEHDVGVTCGFEVRLAGEQNSRLPAGIPEVKMGLGSWGVVCGDGFGTNEAKVVCQHLGLPSDEASVWRSTAFTQGRGPVLMTNLSCNGSESNLLDCSFDFGSSHCNHEHDVGVTCDGSHCTTPDLDCDFEQGFCAYTQLTDDEFDWTRNSGPTTSTDTGPPADHTLGTAAGYYVYIEASSPRQTDDEAHLASPAITDGHTRCLSFWYHMYGDDINALYVYTKVGSRYGQPILTHRGPFANSEWRQTRTTITNNNTYNIVFEGVRGSNYNGDIALDDIQVTCGSCR